MTAPEIRYARNADGVHLAFQTLGDGRLDLVCVGYGNMVSIDMRDEEPHFRRFERRLSSFSRFIRFDPRGLGLSDPIAPGAPSSIEHTGEVEIRGDDVSGVAVHIAQRVSAVAGPSEVLVPRTVVDLVAGLGIRFDDRGEHHLKGLDGPWQLFAVEF